MPNYLLPSQVQSGQVTVTTGDLVVNGTNPPLQLNNMSQLPNTVDASGTTVMVNSMWYVSNGIEWVPTSPITHGSSLNGVLHFQNSLVSTRGTKGTFTRNSSANAPDTLQTLGSNQPIYIQGKFGNGISIWEGTTQIIQNSGFETVTATTTVFSDALTSYTGSTVPAPWTLQSGSFTFNANGATSQTSVSTNSQTVGSIITAGNSQWVPALSSDGTTNLALTAAATFTTPATIGSVGFTLLLLQDMNNAYQLTFQWDNNFVLYKKINGSYFVLGADSKATAMAASTTYTMTLSLDNTGLLTPKLYQGTLASGTLLQTFSVTDTALTGGFLIGVGGDTGVVITNASVSAPWANGWSIADDSRVAWALTTNAISGKYSLSAVGVGSGVTGEVTQSSSGISSNASYTASAYMNTLNEGSSSGAYIQLEIISATNQYNNTSRVTGTSSTSRCTGTFATPSGTTGSILKLIQQDAGTVIFDAIQLEQKPYATPYLRNDSTSNSASRSAETLVYPSSVLNASAGTISGWFNENGLANVTNVLFATSDGSSLWMKKDSSSNTYKVFFNSTSSAQLSFAMPSAGWHHVAVTWSGTSVQVYLDGVLQQSATLSSALTLSNVTSIYIGSYSDGTLQFNGYVDEVAFFNRVLTEPEIYSLFSAAQPLIDVYASDANTIQGMSISSNQAPNSIVVRDSNGNIPGVTNASGTNNWTQQQTFSGGAVLASGQSLINSGTITGGVVNPNNGTVSGSWTVNGVGSFQTINANNLNASLSATGGKQIIALSGGLKTFPASPTTGMWGFGIGNETLDVYTDGNFNVWQLGHSTTTPALTVGGNTNGSPTYFLVKTANNTLDDGSGNQTINGSTKYTSSGATHSYSWQYNPVTNSLDLIYQ